MRKQVAAPRYLPFERALDRRGVDRHQHQVRRSGEMLRRGLANLVCRGKMDEAVAQIDGSAAEHPRALRLAPQCDLADLVDGRRHVTPIRPRPSNLAMITPVSRAVAINPDPATKLKAGVGLFTNTVAAVRNMHAWIA